MQLLEWNSKIILKISDDTVFRLNELVDAVVEKEDIDRYLISVIKGLRKEMGFSGERKELLDDSIRTEDLYNILLPWEEREENIIQQTKRKKKLKKTVDIVHNSLGKVAEKIDVLEKHNDEV